MVALSQFLHPDDAPAGALGQLQVSGCARIDSRRVATGDVFFAAAPLVEERAAHLQQAAAAGAVVALAPAPVVMPPAPASAVLPLHLLPDGPAVRRAYGRAWVRACGLHKRCPPLIAITGTDGKTSLGHICWQLLGPGAARVGTLGWHDGRQETPGRLTTPPADELCAFLAALPADCPGVSLEASSHGLAQYRLGDLPLTVGVITGIGHDHLDYHQDRHEYLQAKLSLIELLRPDGLLIANSDDASWAAVQVRAQACGRACVSLGRAGEARLEGDASSGFRLSLPGELWSLRSRLVGVHNAWNTAAALLALRHLGHSLAAVAARIPELHVVPGRLQRITEEPPAYVDYAHTPAGIQRALLSLRAAHPGQPLVCVVGCGGDRDRSKRGPMLRAGLAAEHCFFTADNPRHEGQAAIAASALAQLAPDERQGLQRLDDRGEAIQAAWQQARAVGGVLVVCGKGHETVQIIGDTLRPWDDAAYLRQLATGVQR